MKHLVPALAGACALFSAAASSGIVHVANNGVDSATCGTAAAPCRSITQGITNALAGDTIVVRPGHYGDNDGSGAIDRAGEEAGAANPSGGRAGVYVNKRVTIISSAGAAATIIDVGNTADSVVVIAADGVKLGERDAGFTLTGASFAGLQVERPTQIVVAGNVATKVGFAGFSLATTGFIEARDNFAIDNGGIGFLLQDINGTSGFVSATNNVAIGNATGIAVGALAPHRVIGNRISNNEEAIAINYGPSLIAQNQVTGNNRGIQINGFSPDDEIPRGPLLVRNNVVGNHRNGVDVFPGPAGIAPVLRENNIFGNGNCGTTNQSQETLDARNNFWGAPTGPSFNDPADAACPGLQPTLTAPFATREFQVR